MTYNGTPQTAVITDPNDSTQTAPVDKAEGLTIQPGPEYYALLMRQTKLLAAVWLVLCKMQGELIDPDKALEGVE